MWVLLFCCCTESCFIWSALKVRTGGTSLRNVRTKAALSLGVSHGLRGGASFLSFVAPILKHLERSWVFQLTLWDTIRTFSSQIFRLQNSSSELYSTLTRRSTLLPLNTFLTCVSADYMVEYEGILFKKVNNAWESKSVWNLKIKIKTWNDVKIETYTLLKRLA